MVSHPRMGGFNQFRKATIGDDGNIINLINITGKFDMADFGIVF